MEDLARIRGSYINDGMSYMRAEARCAQDAMLDLIAKSTFADNITIKGGMSPRMRAAPQQTSISTSSAIR